jgi:hypothetical protein
MTLQQQAISKEFKMALYLRRSLVVIPLFLALFHCTFLVSSLRGSSLDDETDSRSDDDIAADTLWPGTAYVPNNPGYKKLMDERQAQIAAMPSAHDRKEAYLQFVNNAFLVPNFTEHGFGLARAPEELTAALKQGIRDGIPTATLEKVLDSNFGPQSLFVDRSDLTYRVLHEMQPYAEAWSDMDLIPSAAYGFRLYRNSSQLMMHVDLVQTHIISFIYHIDRSEDAESWPLYIEDFHGRTHEVYLTSGDVLFYESAKCLHGRPKPLRGSWYSSVFVHYRPATGWSEIDHQELARKALPPTWKDDPDPDDPVQYEVTALRGSCLMEPNCPNYWCRSKPGTTVKWSGPGKDHVWIDPDFKEHPFHPSKTPRVQRSLCNTKKTQLLESERVDCYYDRNYRWPPPLYVPETPGWRRLMLNRIEQIAEIPTGGPRYQAYVQVVRSAFLVPNFTEHGFGLTRAPERLASTLKEAVHNRILDARGEGLSLEISAPEEMKAALEELRPYAEAWTQRMLTSSHAEGIRLDRNQSFAVMSLNRVETDVISVLFHIDSSYDAQPWPVYIEDFEGRTHEISLTPGDILLYEGAKCFHGRPKKSNGSWHATMVARFYPSDGWSDTDYNRESWYAVPPSWSVNPKPDEPLKHPRLVMDGTLFTEPDCSNGWCNTVDAIRWLGPAKDGVWIDAHLQEHPLELQDASVFSEL